MNWYKITYLDKGGAKRSCQVGAENKEAALKKIGAKTNNSIDYGISRKVNYLIKKRAVNGTIEIETIPFPEQPEFYPPLGTRAWPPNQVAA